ncbi:hypothetical protein Pcinc_041389 [Petrolisthes cinctipes]|uniref:Uncharacterized protein n=1 Tax=Petrolisthes cinctipes TaxID=88211 RepID=A0AAE1BK99_PETCI|nr:hypothetical protein Pcinc_041389 [Petrolisthes cinctipes]
MLHRTTQSAGPSCCELSYSEAAASGVAGRSSEHHHQASKNRGETGGITGKCEEQWGKSDVEKQRGYGEALQDREGLEADENPDSERDILGNRQAMIEQAGR